MEHDPTLRDTLRQVLHLSQPSPKVDNVRENRRLRRPLRSHWFHEYSFHDKLILVNILGVTPVPNLIQKREGPSPQADTLRAFPRFAIRLFKSTLKIKGFLRKLTILNSFTIFFVFISFEIHVLTKKHIYISNIFYFFYLKCQIKISKKILISFDLHLKFI